MSNHLYTHLFPTASQPYRLLLRPFVSWSRGFGQSGFLFFKPRHGSSQGSNLQLVNVITLHVFNIAWRRVHLKTTLKTLIWKEKKRRRAGIYQSVTYMKPFWKVRWRALGQPLDCTWLSSLGDASFSVVLHGHGEILAQTDQPTSCWWRCGVLGNILEQRSQHSPS